MKTHLAAIVATLAMTAAHASAALIVNAAQTVRHAVRVNVINVTDNAGGQAAPSWGTASQQASIFSFVDQIWSQAGIDVQFKFRSMPYANSFALGTPGTTTVRPTSDLNSIVSTAQTNGVLDGDPLVLNLFQVRVVPGFQQTNNTTSNGLAFVGGNGITLWTGPTLPTFTDGQELSAKVLAHEIGHNLGLNHVVESENLLQSSSTNYREARLSASQIATAQNSYFTQVLGDTNDDDTVDFDDLLALAENYGATSGVDYSTGDFDFNGTADFSDLLILAKNYNYAFAGASGGGFTLPATGYADFDIDGSIASLMVPEPATAMLAIATLGLIGRRRRC